MILKRKELWGEVIYDTNNHFFKCNILDQKDKGVYPYPSKPLVLNIDLTLRCNMICTHCVAKDMEWKLGGIDNSDLIITKKLLQNINNSPFMEIVITGGEPLFPSYEANLKSLVAGLKSKGLIIDTNGTIIPSLKMIKLFKRRNVLLRISWDIPHPKYESLLRKYPKHMFSDDLECIEKKQEGIRHLISKNIKLAVQTVIHKYNYNNNNLHSFPYKLKQLRIKDWYIQRFIPSNHSKELELSLKEYDSRLQQLTRVAEKLGIKCHFKRDRRHNSVFLLVKDGDLYTQSDDKPGEKIYLGKLGKIGYFSFVSAPDHSSRYLV